MKNIPILLLAITLFSGCIGNDIVFDEVDPVIRIANPVDSLAVNTSHHFGFSYLNNVGVEELVIPEWESSQTDIISIDNSGLATALKAGLTSISVRYDNGIATISDSKMVVVGDNTVVTNTNRSGTIKTTSSYALQGDFELMESGSDLILTFADNYKASTSLPGLYIYLTNNPSTTANALELGKVEVFSGAHTYTIKDVAINDYSHVLYFCKPFNVKVGDGEIQ